ncbi:fungal specific transcription factor domain-containing protein [Pyrenophora teres f. maculata]|nr:fungal specific transcription factor domain-containing protein [Pyrenophora teres f. maculata]
MRSNFGPSSESSSPQPQRLPVNPRRRKVAPEERKRVVRACNACNVRRVKCTGEQPCQRCHKASRQCEYPPQETQKHSLKDELERLQQRCAALEAGFQAAAPDEAAGFIAQLDQRRPASHSTAPTFHSISEELDQADTNHGRLLVDSYGVRRFFGETSGATFLDHLKQFMLTLVPLTFHPDSADGSSFVASVGSYQTYDSRPFPNPNVDPLWLPAQPDMASMLGELRAYIQHGNGEFASGGIYCRPWWGDLSNSPAPTTSSVSLSTVTSAEDSFRYLAFYHVAFALATCLGQSDFRRSDQHAGEAYFNRARKLLGNPLDIVRFTLSDVSVLALMGFYLIELNRRDAAYVHVSNLDAVIQARHFTDLENMSSAMPSCAGLRAHIELSRISGYIVCETFKIAPRYYTPGHSTLNVDKALKMLADWKSQLPHVLAADESADPAVLSLHLAANQLIVLTTRPILLAAVKQAVAERYMNGQWSLQQHAHITHIQACLEAAHRNLVLAQRLRSKRKLLQAGLHFVFNAAVILFLEQIMSSFRSHKTPPSPNAAAHGPKLEFAIRTFADESKTGTNYPRDCFKILQDLEALVHRYLSHGHGNFVHGSNASLGANAGAPGSHVMAQPGPETQNNPNGPESSNLYQEMRIWIQSDGLQLQNSLLI